MPRKSKSLSKRRVLLKNGNSKRVKARVQTQDAPSHASIPRIAKPNPIKQVSRDEMPVAQRRTPEMRLANILENSSEALVTVNSKHEIILFNQAAERMFGYTAKEILGQPIDLLLPKQLIEIHRLHFRTFAASLEKTRPMANRSDLSARRKDGSVFPVEIGLSRIVEDGEEVFSATLIDISERKRLEEALIASEIRYRRLFETAKDGILILDAETGIIVDVNPFLITLLGFSRDALLGKHIWELGFFKDVIANKVNFLELQQKEYIRYENLPLETAGGRRINVEFVSNVYLVNHEKVIQCNIRDITARKHTEDALAASEAQLRALFAAMRDAVLVIDREGIYREIAPTNPAFWHIPPQELLGKRLQDVFPAHQAKFFYDIVQQVLDTKQNKQMEYELQRGNRPVWFEASVSPLNVDTTIWVARDVTERKRIEEAVRQSEVRYRALIEQASDGIFVTNAQGRYLEVNTSGCAMLGYTHEEILNMDWTHILLPEDLAQDPPKLDDLLAGKTIIKERIYKRKDGTVFPVEISAKILSDGRIQNIVRDITARKRAEEEIERQLLRVQALHQIDLAISNNDDLRQTMNTFLTHLMVQLDVDAAAVLLFHPHSKLLEYAAGRGFRTEALQHTHLLLGDGLAGRAALERKTIAISNLNEEIDGLARSLTFQSEGFVVYFGVPLIAKGRVNGVLEVFHRAPMNPDNDWLKFLETLAGQGAIAIDNAELFNELQRASTELELAYDRTLEGWSRALDLRDHETEGHTLRVTETALRLAREVGMRDEELVQLRRGGLLHDIGKMGIPDSVLLKPGSLTDLEWEVMRQHPDLAYQLLSPIEYLRPALDIPYCHHEKWDGTGYPRGLKGEQIPFASRVFAIVDVWDALRSNRVYRQAWSEEKTLEYLREQSGKHFDPQIAKKFLKMIAQK